MNKLLNMVMDRLTDLALPLAMLAAALVPTVALSPAAAWAEDSSELDRGRHGGSGGEGDPLDTNDTDGEGDPDEDVQNSSSFWDRSGAGDLGRISPTTRFILVPQYRGNTLSFEVIIMDTQGNILRRSHAR
ncbi:MAG: hypothetical protein ACI9UQ_001172 [Candidatus Krumholzibacteriia bacterium]|jgi:hypothetical protein